MKREREKRKKDMISRDTERDRKTTEGRKEKRGKGRSTKILTDLIGEQVMKVTSLMTHVKLEYLKKNSM